MGLFDLVKQHDAVGVAAHGLGQLAAFLITDISRRGADQAGDAELLHIFGHVDADEVLLIVKQRFGQRLGQLGLADAGRPEEEETADRPAGVRNAGAGAQNRIRDLLHGLVLADDPLVQYIGQAEQLFALTLNELLNRDAGPPRDDAGNLLIGHAVAQQALLLLFGRDLFLLFELALQVRQFAVLQFAGLGVIAVAGGLFDLGFDRFDLGAQALHLADRVLLVLPLGFLRIEGVPKFGQLFFEIGQPLFGEFVALLLQRGLLNLQLGDAVVHLVEFGRHRIELGLDHRAGFIDEVDRLVRQEPVGDIPVGKGGRRNERAVLDFDAVVDFVPLLQAAQDRDRILDRRLTDHNGLEPALERGVFLDVFAVFVKGGCADAVQLAAGQHRFE